MIVRHFHHSTTGAALALALLVAGCGGGSRDERDTDRATVPGQPAGKGGAEADTGRDRAAHDSGASVEGGEGPDSPARVTLTAAALQTAAIVVEPARAEAPGTASSGLDVPGQVDYDPSRVALISPRTAGRLERLLVVEGDHVVAGQTVAQLYSPAFVTAQTDLQQAARRAALLGGTADAEGATALLAAARRRLRLLGVNDASVDRVEAGGEPATLLPIPAPFGGTIVEAQALAGAAVEAGTPLFRIADLAAADVVAQVPERALPYLKIGQAASVGIAAYPALRFTGRVERIKAEIDPATRTVKAVLHVSNTGLALRPGMFASVRLDVPLGTAVAGSAVSASAATGGAGASSAPVVTIPESAIVTDGERRYVFVEVGPRTYERRLVQVTSAAPAGAATAASGRVAVLAGLAANERVVVRGAFTLKSELAKASLAEDES